MLPHCYLMFKTARIFVTLLLAALLLPACLRQQAPTPSDRGTGFGSGNPEINDIIPNGELENYGLDDDLELRDNGDGGIENGEYNGQRIIEGILNPVYYGFDSSAISASERSKLELAADYLSKNPGHNLLIEGHCDWYGTAEFNIALGERRANSAMDYLLTLGVSPNRLNTISKGSLEAITGLGKVDAAKDRRADLNVLK